MHSYFIWTVSGVSGIVRSNFIFHTWIIAGMLSEPVLWYTQRGILKLHFKTLRKTYTVRLESYTAYILLAICFNLQFLHLTMESLCYQKFTINKACSHFYRLLFTSRQQFRSYYTNYSANYPRDDAFPDPVSSLSGFAYVSRFPIYFYHGPLASSIGFSASRVCFI